MEWRPVIGFEGWYEVSEAGDVRRVCGGSNRTYVGRALRQQTSKKGYATVGLSRAGTTRRRPVHILVAAAFIGSCPDGKQVNHEDTNKKNNHYTNLEYTTCLGNIKHAVAHGLRASKQGTLNGQAKLSVDAVRRIREEYAGGTTQPSLAAKYGLTQANVSSIVLRKTWAHVG